MASITSSITMTLYKSGFDPHGNLEFSRWAGPVSVNFFEIVLVMLLYSNNYLMILKINNFVSLLHVFNIIINYITFYYLKVNYCNIHQV